MKKAVILHSDIAADAPADELDCLRQAEAVSVALRRHGYETTLLACSLDLEKTAQRLRHLKPEIVFNLVETLAGRGALIYLACSLLDFLEIPYTGCPTEAMFITSNKPLAKRIMRHAGIDTPDWLETNAADFQTAPAEKYIIKSAWEHASIGLDESALIDYTHENKIREELHRRREKLGGACFAEAFIEGREFNVGLIADKGIPRVLPIAEMLFQNYAPGKPRLVDYRAKWVEDSFEYNNTIRKFDHGPEDTALIGRLRDISLRCWKLFALRGYARVDFRVDQNGRPWVLEVNANPCLSPDAGFVAALQQAHIAYHEAIGLILHDAMKI